MTSMNDLKNREVLTALPVYNEADSVGDVLDQVVRYCPNVLVVDDGSTDATSRLLASRTDISVETHQPNRGYGAALTTAFEFAIEHGFQYLITIDCDGQHEPQRIQQFFTAIKNTNADIVSGSRYLRSFENDTPPPQQRRRINQTITSLLNDLLGLGLTDAFCGFKAYRTEALEKLDISVTGYAMPLELWVQAACHELSVVEVAVPLIYLDESRSFGGNLDDGNTRLNYYREVIRDAMEKLTGDCTKVLHGERVG